MPNELEKSVVINHESIIDCIKAQMQTIFTNPDNREYFKDVKNLYIDDEQSFVRRETYEKSIYLVIHFGDSTINIGTSACNVTIKALGSDNEVKPTRNLLSLFASEFNTQYMLNSNGNYNTSVIQTWNPPVIFQNFIEVGTGFKNFANLIGMFIISKQDNILDVAIDGVKFDDEIIPFLSFNDSLRNSLDPQPFLGNERTKSEVKFGTYAFTISISPMKCKLLEKVYRLMGFQKIVTNEIVEDNINDDFHFVLTCTDGITQKEGNFKLASVDRRKSTRTEISSIVLSFSE